MAPGEHGAAGAGSRSLVRALMDTGSCAKAMPLSRMSQKSAAQPYLIAASLAKLQHEHGHQQPVKFEQSRGARESHSADVLAPTYPSCANRAQDDQSHHDLRASSECASRPRPDVCSVLKPGSTRAVQQAASIAVPLPAVVNLSSRLESFPVTQDQRPMQSTTAQLENQQDAISSSNVRHVSPGIRGPSSSRENAADANLACSNVQHSNRNDVTAGCKEAGGVQPCPLACIERNDSPPSPVDNPESMQAVPETSIQLQAGDNASLINSNVVASSAPVGAQVTTCSFDVADPTQACPIAWPGCTAESQCDTSAPSKPTGFPPLQDRPMSEIQELASSERFEDSSYCPVGSQDGKLLQPTGNGKHCCPEERITSPDLGTEANQVNEVTNPGSDVATTCNATPVNAFPDSKGIDELDTSQACSVTPLADGSHELGGSAQCVRLLFGRPHGTASPVGRPESTQAQPEDRSMPETFVQLLADEGAVLIHSNILASSAPPDAEAATPLTDVVQACAVPGFDSTAVSQSDARALSQSSVLQSLHEKQAPEAPEAGSGDASGDSLQSSFRPTRASGGDLPPPMGQHRCLMERVACPRPDTERGQTAETVHAESDAAFVDSNDRKAAPLTTGCCHDGNGIDELDDVMSPSLDEDHWRQGLTVLHHDIDHAFKSFFADKANQVEVLRRGLSARMQVLDSKERQFEELCDSIASFVEQSLPTDSVDAGREAYDAELPGSQALHRINRMWRKALRLIERQKVEMDTGVTAALQRQCAELDARQAEAEEEHRRCLQELEAKHAALQQSLVEAQQREDAQAARYRSLEEDSKRLQESLGTNGEELERLSLQVSALEGEKRRQAYDWDVERQEHLRDKEKQSGLINELLLQLKMDRQGNRQDAPPVQKRRQQEQKFPHLPPLNSARF